MTSQSTTTPATSQDVDAILYLFELACPNPDASETAAWQTRYPQFAGEISQRAACILDPCPRSWAAAIEASTMSEERKAYWLGED